MRTGDHRTERRARGARKSTIFVVAVLAAVAVLGSDRVSAQPSCEAVASSADLAACIDDYNGGSSDVMVTLSDDFSLDAPFPTIDHGDVGVLTIDGAGHTITLASTGSLRQDAGTVVIEALTLTDSLGDGYEIRGGTATISGSTSAGNDASGVYVHQSGALSVVNSTLTGNRDGVFVAGANASLSLDLVTIVDNTEQGLDGFESLLANVEVLDSLIARNASFECSFPPGGSTDGSVFADSTCGPAATAGLESSLAASPADNGCVSPCTHTVALLSGSPAIDAAGLCSLGADQRGMTRPIGAGCDAGAFEADPCATATATPTVTTAAELDTAIDCYNRQQPAGSHAITVGADIAHPDGTPPITQGITDHSLTITSDATLRTITGPGVGSAPGEIFHLFTIGGAAPVTISNLALSDAFADAIRSNEASTVIVSNVTITAGKVGIGNYGGTITISSSSIAGSSIRSIGNFDSGTMTVSDSTISGGEVVNDGNSAMTVSDSTISGGDVGLENGNGTVMVTNSTITNTGYRAIRNYDRVTVSNSTIAGNADGIYNDDTMTVSNSTITGNSGYGITDDSYVTVVSSIIAGNGQADCEGGNFDGGNNFDGDGSCGFDLLVPAGAGSVAPLADNGGPTETQALVVGSNAIDAGNCTDVVVGLDGAGETVTGEPEFDQRGAGYPRSVGSACDAGAFELQAVLCGLGFFSADGYSPCLPAPVGSFVASEGATGATPCATGSWSYSEGASECVVLPLCDGETVTVVWGPGASATSGDDVILGTGGSDVIDALGGDDRVCAGDGNDTVVGGDGDDRLFGEGGRDILRGQTGSDLVDGGPGADRVLGGIGNDVMFGRDGDDYLGGFGGDDTIDGGPGDETIYGGFGADTISGGAGDDVIHGLIGNDTINGGPGNDVLDGDRGSDTIRGGSGADTVNGGNAGDELFGEGGNDSVNGGRADDVLSGGFGTDVCAGNLHFAGDTTDGSCETVFGVP